MKQLIEKTGVAGSGSSLDRAASDPGEAATLKRRSDKDGTPKGETTPFTRFIKIME